MAGPQQKTTLVILAAGMGSRYGGIKQLDSFGENGETIIEYALYDAERAGFTEALFIIRHEIEEDFKKLLLDRIKSKLRISLAFQETSYLPESWKPTKATLERKKPWGTAHALWCARASLLTPFAVINADDFYGARSFELMQSFLSSVDPSKDSYAMVAFELGKTLSPHGSVSRGICDVDEEGYLRDIVEHKKLIMETEGIVSLQDDGTKSVYAPSTAVSMNMFGFTPTVLPRIGALLLDFLKAESEDPKSEFYLPLAVRSLLKQKAATVRVLRSADSWFGVTYQEDRPAVRESVQKLVAQGQYPSSLRG